jgi:hypothetical protein
MVMSLVELCVRSAIDNLSHLGDVGHTDMRLLEVILPHCDADQLLHVETSTKVGIRLSFVNFFLLCIVFLFSQVPTQVLASTKMMLVHEL